jgi:hypothetical protein
MSPRRTNLALLLALGIALVSGAMAFAAGTGWGRPVVVAHGLAGLAALVLACTGGWYARATWEGVRLDRLLRSAPATASRPAWSPPAAAASGGSTRVVSIELDPSPWWRQPPFPPS